MSAPARGLGHVLAEGHDPDTCQACLDHDAGVERAYVKPGTVVAGAFWSDDDRPRGIGVVVARSRALWTQVPPQYVAVRVLHGDRISGGYRIENLTPIDGLARA